MVRFAWMILWLLGGSSLRVESSDNASYFSLLRQLNFKEAHHVAKAEKDTLLRAEMIRLADLLFHAGQKDKSYFKKPDTASLSASNNSEQIIFQLLYAGYYHLFYDQVKGQAYLNIYKAYQLANESGNPRLIKQCLYAFLKYHSFEIVQNSNYYQPYLDHLIQLRSDETDDVWITIYQLIFYSKSLTGLDDDYFALSAKLDSFENSLEKESPLLALVYYERALMLLLQGNSQLAATYYSRTVSQTAPYPCLHTERFLSLIRLMTIATGERNFTNARNYLRQAKQHINKADTLRSNYYLNLYSSMLLHAESKNDSAYLLLSKAYRQDFQLDFRRNTLEINRLNVELETTEKEYANLRLKQGRIWLISALAGMALLFISFYFAYLHQRSKNRIQLKEKEVQAMKIEKLLTDQEMVSIDAMIEGQEKERQRIADELHDNLGSLMVTLKHHFSSLKNKYDRNEPEREILVQRTDALIEEAYQKVRTIAHTKNAGVNAKQGLVPAIRHFASKVTIINKLRIDVEEYGMDQRLDNSVELMIFRIVQELITNSIKHAEASEVVISLTKHDEVLNLMVEDNGKGFEISKVKQGETMGLYSIQKKIESLGGNVTIDSVVGKGTSVIIDIPLV